jgi:hypothetical protein
MSSVFSNSLVTAGYFYIQSSKIWTNLLQNTHAEAGIRAHNKVLIPSGVVALDHTDLKALKESSSAGFPMKC